MASLPKEKVRAASALVQHFAMIRARQADRSRWTFPTATERRTQTALAA